VQVNDGKACEVRPFDINQGLHATAMRGTTVLFLPLIPINSPEKPVIAGSSSQMCNHAACHEA
jgi:hypothetical protein